MKEVGDIFTTLSEQLEATAKEIQNQYEEITKTVLDEYFNNFEKNLKSTSGNKDLNDKMTVFEPKYKSGQYYIRSLDWDDKIIVNVDKGKGYGQQAKRIRERGKRNYSVYPATYHDLAYIINHGHGGVMGNNFIDSAKRKLKRWESKRDKLFDKYLDGIKGK